MCQLSSLQDVKLYSYDLSLIMVESFVVFAEFSNK